MSLRFPSTICVALAFMASFSQLAFAAEPNTLTPQELDGGWILLFDGQTDFGWHAEKKADWKVTDGTITVSSGEPGLLATTSEFADYELRLEFRARAAPIAACSCGRRPCRPIPPRIATS